LAATVVLAGCLKPVSLREVYLNQRLMRALAQRLGANGGQAGLNCLTIPPGSSKSLAHCFECMQAEMVVPLTVHHEPILIIPIR
jgi:hypothetical protein